ncbi:MAG: DUF3472 domain-containing protein [Acidobacteria bacterium]|nr:DUF3472 domain-containing protein [Acidobacteriota bacterium]MYJ04632.1 DUF3472 domain-containing protein [Acidobacteriota bacterium]
MRYLVGLFVLKASWKRFLFLLVTACALAACKDSPVSPTPMNPITPSLPQMLASVEFSGLPRVEAGKMSPRPLTAVVLDQEGQPIAGASYRWEADSHAGWVFPSEGTTTANGRIEADWVAGTPGQGHLTLRVQHGTEELAAVVETTSLRSRSPPLSALTVFVQNSFRGADGIAAELTPLTEPVGTYYAALQWARGYAGLQRGGRLYDRQLQFSVWDNDQGGAEVVREGDGVHCRMFGNEGTGRACELNYPWRTNATYLFEVEAAELRGGTSLTLHVTDQSTGARRFIGTLRDARRIDLGHDFSFFVEDFRRDAPTCLAQPVRQAAIRNAMARSNGSWHSLTSGFFFHPSSQTDAGNPGTSHCVNIRVESHAHGLAVSVGGHTAMDPAEPTVVAIP